MVAAEAPPAAARRAFLQAAAVLLFAAGRSSFAQTPKVYRVGILTAGTAAAERARFDDFTRGLDELGYREGRNVQLERRYADGNFDRLPALATELAAQKVDVIVGMSTLATKAAMQATRTIPIVFATVADPVGEGFAASLAHPGGNVTGVSNAGTALSGKLLQLLKDAFPRTARVAVFTAPRAPHAAAQLAELETAARALRMEILGTQLRRREEVEPVLARLREWRADALYVMQGAENSAVRDLLVELAAASRLPAVFPQRNYVEAGGLMSYGPDFDANYRRAASYVDRILKGAKPGDLPIEQPTKFELVINGKTARASGWTIPPSVLLRADRLIE
jgi:putative tryptophan/tyrosine transport system substrate-binding protein